MASEIPLSLYLFMCSTAIGLIIFSLVYNENFVRIITSFIATVLSYVNAMVILNGNVVVIQSTGTTFSYIPVEVPALNYLWLFFAILSFILMCLFIADLINVNIQTELDEKEAEATYEFQ